MAEFPLDIIQTALEIAGDVLSGVQTTVGIKYLISESGGGGTKTYSLAEIYPAFVDMTNKTVMKDGQLVLASGEVLILEEIKGSSAVLRVPRRKGIDPRDRIVLSSGAEFPILSAPNAIENPENGQGIYTRIVLG